MESVLARDRKGDLWWKKSGDPGFRRVYRVRDVCRMIRRGRRQVYRHLEKGDLRSCDRFLDDLLVDADSVARWLAAPTYRQPLPKALERLFPEYDVRDLNAGRHRALVVSRVLEEGTLSDLRWMVRRYGWAGVKKVLEEDGGRLLTLRTLNLWRRVFRSRPLARSWRLKNDHPWRERVG